MSNHKENLVKKIGLISVIVVDIVGYTVGGVAAGYLLWSKLGFPWWVLLITSSAGLSLGMYRLYQLTKKEL
jgi:hypothetical protein